MDPRRPIRPKDSGFLQGLDACLKAAPPTVTAGEGCSFRVPLIPRNAWVFDRGGLADADRRLQEFMTAQFPDFRPFPATVGELSLLHDAIVNLDGRDLADFASAREIPLPLFTLYCIYLARPFREAVPGDLRAGLASHEGRATFCPLCGAPPTMAVEGGGGPRIWCVHCGGLRTYPTGLCPSCAKPVAEPGRLMGLKLLTCTACRRYVKLFPPDAGPRLDLLFVSTGTADEQALREGFVKEYPILPAAPLVGRA